MILETLSKDHFITVYCAGAYTGQIMDVARNIRKGRRLAIELMCDGLNVYCPWNDWELAVVEEIPVEAFQRVSIAYLLKSDCMILVPGWKNSKGTKREIAIAKERGIPVFQTKKGIREWRMRVLHPFFTRGKNSDLEDWQDIESNLPHSFVARDSEGYPVID